MTLTENVQQKLYFLNNILLEKEPTIYILMILKNFVNNLKIKYS